MRSTKSVVVVVLMVTFAGGSASSQEATHAKATDAQLRLYKQAGAAYTEQRFSDAIELLRSSLAVGELNVTYLNLGRAYFRDGQCDKAADAYRRARMAPEVAEPAAADVAKRLDQYETELSSCPGIVQPRCLPTSLTISVDHHAPVRCGPPLKLSPGEHVLSAAEGDLLVTHRIVVRSRQTVEVLLDATPKARVAPADPPSDIGLIIAGSGVALVGAAALFDVLSIGPDIEDYETAVEEGSSDEGSLRDSLDSQQLGVAIAYGVGGAAVLTGLTLTLIDRLGQSKATRGTASWQPWLSPGVAGVSVGAAW